MALLATGLGTATSGCGRSQAAAQPELIEVDVVKLHGTGPRARVRLPVPAGWTLVVDGVNGVKPTPAGRPGSGIKVEIEACPAELKGTACIRHLHQDAKGAWKDQADGVVVVDNPEPPKVRGGLPFGAETTYRYDAATGAVISCRASLNNVPAMARQLRKVCAALELPPASK